MSRVLDEYVERLLVNQAVIRETRLRVLLAPKPWWLPEFVWRRVVARLLVIEESA
jgi:hypothetical protein